MKILSIIYYTVKRNFRDLKSLSSMLFFPILLILILGSALSSLYAPPNIDKVKVCYINRDKGDISKHFDKYLEEDAIKNLLEVKKVNSLEDGKKLLDDREVRSIIEIDEDYSERVIKGEKASIKVYSSKYGNLKTSIVQSIVDAFIDGSNTAMVMMNNGSSQINIKQYKSVKDKPISIEGKVPRAIDYYAVTMLVMTLMYGALYACYGVGEELFSDIGNRIRTASIKTYETIIGKTLGTVLTVFIQGMVLTLFAKYAYKTNWGSNMGLIVLIIFSLSVLSTSLGIMACTLVRDARKGSGLLSILIVIATFISGGYTKINGGSETFEKIRYMIPNQLGHTALFNTIYGGSASSIQMALTSMWLLTILLFGISLLAGRRVMK